MPFGRAPPLRSEPQRLAGESGAKLVVDRPDIECYSSSWGDFVERLHRPVPTGSNSRARIRVPAWAQYPTMNRDAPHTGDMEKGQGHGFPETGTEAGSDAIFQ
jgi:hypothetical protein